MMYTRLFVIITAAAVCLSVSHNLFVDAAISEGPLSSNDNNENNITDRQTARELIRSFGLGNLRDQSKWKNLKDIFYKKQASYDTSAQGDAKNKGIDERREIIQLVGFQLNSVITNLNIVSKSIGSRNDKLSRTARKSLLNGQKDLTLITKSLNDLSYQNKVVAATGVQSRSTQSTTTTVLGTLLGVGLRAANEVLDLFVSIYKNIGCCRLTIAYLESVGDFLIRINDIVDPSDAAPFASVPSSPTTVTPVGAPVAPQPVAPSPVASTPTAPVPVASTPTAPVPGASTPTAPIPGASTPTAPVPGASTPTAPIPGATPPNASFPVASTPTATVPVAPAGPTTSTGSSPTGPISNLPPIYAQQSPSAPKPPSAPTAVSTPVAPQTPIGPSTPTVRPPDLPSTNFTNFNNGTAPISPPVPSTPTNNASAPRPTPIP